MGRKGCLIDLILLCAIGVSVLGSNILGENKGYRRAVEICTSQKYITGTPDERRTLINEGNKDDCWNYFLLGSGVVFGGATTALLSYRRQEEGKQPQ